MEVWLIDIDTEHEREYNLRKGSSHMINIQGKQV